MKLLDEARIAQYIHSGHQSVLERSDPQRKASTLDHSRIIANSKIGAVKDEDPIERFAGRSQCIDTPCEIKTHRR